jgi:hypothetical protein
MKAKPTCSIHPEQVLICPSCFASSGGKTTAKKHAAQLSEWGKRGGRPRKPKETEDAGKETS